MELTEDNIDEYNRRQLFILNAMPDEWLRYAGELRDAAEILWQDQDQGMKVSVTDNLTEGSDLCKNNMISRTYILLSGLALENLLKGLMIAQKPSLLASGMIKGDLKTHKLLSLVANIEELELSTDEKRMCKTAQEAIPSWGRYPVPLRPEDLAPEVAATQEYRKTFLELYYRLGKMIYTLVRDGWDSGQGPRIIKIRDRTFGDTWELNEPFFD